MKYIFNLINILRFCMVKLGVSSSEIRSIKVLHLKNISSNMTELLQSLIALPSIKILDLGENNITSIAAIHGEENERFILVFITHVLLEPFLFSNY